MKICATLAIAAAVFGADAADAGTLASGPLQSDTFLCDIVNVGPKPIRSVTLDIINSFTAQVLESETCTDVQPNTECVVFFQVPQDALRAFCAVTVTGSANGLRGSLHGGGRLLDLR